MKAEVNSIIYKMYWYKGGDFTKNPVELVSIDSHSSQEGIELENNVVDLSFKLNNNKPFNYNGEIVMVHQFVDETTGKLMLSSKDIIRIYVKYNDGVAINPNSREHVLQDYFVKSWNIKSSDNNITIKCVDVNYKVFNRIWNGNYGVNDTGTYTSITSNTLTDTTKNWGTDNKYKDRTLQFTDATGIIYPFLILSHTSDTITVYGTIPDGMNTEYLIGHSSPSAIVNALKNVVTATAYTGSFDMNINTTLDISTKYSKGVQLLRNDGSGFPIIDYSLNRKPYYELINELSSINAINTSYEIEHDTKIMLRDMVYSVRFNTDDSKYELDWFYLDSPEKKISSTVTSVTNNVLTDTSLSLATNELTNNLLRINNRTYQILSNTSNSITVDRDINVTLGFNYLVLGNIDFIWDSKDDFKNIFNYDLGTDTDEAFNHIFFSCGTNPLNDREIIGHKLNETSNSSELKEVYYPFKGIVRMFLDRFHDNRYNQVTGKYEYPTYPYTPNWGGFKSNEVTDDASYNVELKRVCRLEGYKKCESLFSQVKEGFLKGKLSVRGNRFIKSGDSSPISKWYSTGSRILFKHVEGGIVNDKQINGYFYLRVKSIRHSISTTRWETSLDVEWDIYSETENSKDLSL